MENEGFIFINMSNQK